MALVNATEYAPWANANIMVCVSIESLEGLENIAAIAAVEGIDMIAYGHSDLSARLGFHLQLEHPIFKAAVRRIADACNTRGKLARGSAETEAQIEEYGIRSRTWNRLRLIRFCTRTFRANHPALNSGERFRSP